MRFDPVDLRLFLCVIDAGSITHGSAEAGLSLPAASERLRDMEAAAGVALLERGRRGVSSTQAGEALAHHARVILRQMEQMRSELGEHARSLRATIRLLANTVAIAEFLPGKLGPWLARHPTVDLDLKERQSIEIARAISGGLADLGILSSAADTGALQLRPFAIDRLVVVASRDHPLSTAQRVCFADILHHEFVGLAGGALQDHIDAQAAKVGAKLRTRIRLRTFEGVCRLVGENVGLGIVPETAARRCRRSMAIGSVRLIDAWATRRLSICFRAEEDLTLHARNLVAHLSS